MVMETQTNSGTLRAFRAYSNILLKLEENIVRVGDEGEELFFLSFLA